VRAARTLPPPSDHPCFTCLPRAGESAQVRPMPACVLLVPHVHVKSSNADMRGLCDAGDLKEHGQDAHFRAKFKSGRKKVLPGALVMPVH
jgi:hypothetical protein